MQKIKVTTAQNVDIEYRVASIGTRILSCLLDYFILFVLYVGVLFVYEYYIEIFNQMGENIVYIIFFAILLPFIFYDLLCEIFMNGQSFAKKITGIKVIKLDGSKPSISNYLLRWMLRIIDITIGYGSIGVITLLINGKGQRIGDIAANTVVVNIKSKIDLKDTVLMDLDQDYSIKFDVVVRLNDSDITTIKEVLNFANKNPHTESTNIMLGKLKINLEKKMNIETDMPIRELLMTIIKDYNHLHGTL